MQKSFMSQAMRIGGYRMTLVVKILAAYYCIYARRCKNYCKEAKAIFADGAGKRR